MKGISIKEGDVLVFDTGTIPDIKENSFGLVYKIDGFCIFTDFPSSCLDKRDWVVTNYIKDKMCRKVFIKRRR